MKRRAFLKSLGGTAVAATMSRGSWAQRESRRPNVLFIMTDQQFAESMSCTLGSRYLKTPAMDGLAATGMMFTRAYCGNPLCIPSRTSMFTGRYPSETGVQTNNDKSLDHNRFPCIGSTFERAGYDNGFVGKWHLPFPNSDKRTHGFDFLGGNRDAEKPGLAVEFMKRKRTRPFFLVVSLLNPHNICEWARGEKLPDGEVGEPPALAQCPPLRPNHEPQKDEPDAMTLMRRSYQSTRMFPVGSFDEKKWREYIWAYYRMIEKVDAQIGIVLQALRESGQEETTVVVLTADHGDCQGAHRWNQKTVLYDEASRVPFIISHSGQTKRGTSDRLVHTGVDLMPTLCDFAGIPIPSGLPGISLKPAVLGQDSRETRKFVVVSNHMVQGAPIDGVLPTPSGRMVRSRNYKYCAYSQGDRRESLVDMVGDPGEMVNLAGSIRHRDVLEEHRKYLAEWIRQTNDSFTLPGH